MNERSISFIVINETKGLGVCVYVGLHLLYMYMYMTPILLVMHCTICESSSVEVIKCITITLSPGVNIKGLRYYTCILLILTH